MKLHKYFSLSIVLLVTFLTAACAVDPEEDSNYGLDRVMKAWIRVNYPGLKPFENTDSYVLEMVEGTGAPVVDSAYVWVHYAKRNLDQTVTSTNIQELAEQIGTYSVTANYGSNIWRVDQGYLPDDLEDVIKSLRAGGHAKVALPASASGHDRSLYSAFSSLTETTNQIIDVTIDTVVTDIYDYQERIMKAWFRERYGVSDTAAAHLYLKKLVEKTAEEDTIPEGNTVRVRYVGRLMDGRVFDTNIEDTAKFYRIYKSNGSYNALSIEYYRTDTTKFSSANSVVKGFGKGVTLMNYGEKAVVLFSSQLGYGEKGSSPSIPEYSPLSFWLYIEPK